MNLWGQLKWPKGFKHLNFSLTRSSQASFPQGPGPLGPLGHRSVMTWFEFRLLDPLNQWFDSTQERRTKKKETPRSYWSFWGAGPMEVGPKKIVAKRKIQKNISSIECVADLSSSVNIRCSTLCNLRSLVYEPVLFHAIPLKSFPNKNFRNLPKIDRSWNACWSWMVLYGCEEWEGLTWDSFFCSINIWIHLLACSLKSLQKYERYKLTMGHRPPAPVLRAGFLLTHEDQLTRRVNLQKHPEMKLTKESKKRHKQFPLTMWYHGNSLKSQMHGQYSTT